MKPIGFARNVLSYVGIGRRNAMLKPGDPAPAFAVHSHFGSELRLADLAGKYVVLWFYPKADTPG
jgi:thioredoxin-dependent peroxiredoxin